jgi:hypothetical protein
MWKFVFAAILSLTVVSCGQTQEEKQKDAQNNMASHTRSGNVNRAQGVILADSAIRRLESKSIEKHSEADLKGIKADLTTAEKKLQASTNSYNLVLATAKKSDDHNVKLLNPEDFVRLIRENRAIIKELHGRIEKVDAELAKKANGVRT